MPVKNTPVKFLTKSNFLSTLKKYLEDESLTAMASNYDDVVLEEGPNGYLRIGMDGSNKYITSSELEESIPDYVDDVPLTDLIFFLTLKQIRAVSNELINRQMAFYKCEQEFREHMDQGVMKKLKKDFVTNQCQTLVNRVLNQQFLCSLYIKTLEKFLKKLRIMTDKRKAARTAFDTLRLRAKIEKYAIKITKGIVEMWHEDIDEEIVVTVHRDYKDLFVTYEGNYTGNYSKILGFNLVLKLNFFVLKEVNIRIIPIRPLKSKFIFD